MRNARYCRLASLLVLRAAYVLRRLSGGSQPDFESFAFVAVSSAFVVASLSCVDESFAFVVASFSCVDESSAFVVASFSCVDESFAFVVASFSCVDESFAFVAVAMRGTLKGGDRTVGDTASARPSGGEAGGSAGAACGGPAETAQAV
jgi:hypothetical protein